MSFAEMAVDCALRGHSFSALPVTWPYPTLDVTHQFDPLRRGSISTELTGDDEADLLDRVDAWRRRLHEVD
jgi:hypothetical protein